MALSWVGMEVDGFEIEKELGRGAFSTVYLGRRNGSAVALKVARPAEEEPSEADTGCYATAAWAPGSSGIAEIQPEPNDLLSLQHQLLSRFASVSHCLVAPSELHEVAGLKYYSMPAFESTNLRASLGEKPALEAFVGLLAEFDKLTSAESFAPGGGTGPFVHGDIKPENIMLTDSGAVLIDPGYFGPLRSSGVTLSHCSVTTPEYYPLHAPDDMFALGLVLWELVLGVQPFKQRKFARDCDRSRCGPQLWEMVDDLEKVSRYGFSAILDVPFPCTIRLDLSDKQEQALLTALRLQRQGNQIELAAGFNRPAELAVAAGLFL